MKAYGYCQFETWARFIKVAKTAISAGMAAFVIISQSEGRITPVVMTAAIPAQVCYHIIQLYTETLGM